jgi:hypothetical protein
MNAMTDGPYTTEAAPNDDANSLPVNVTEMDAASEEDELLTPNAEENSKE